MACAVAVSLATAAPEPSKIQDLTIATLRPATADYAALDKHTRRGDIALSALLLLVIAAIWTIFSY